MKLQPNFSWQKYEGNPEDAEEQFQYQLQTMHIKTANAVNATIDDMSYFTKERPTGETWIDGQQLYTKTISGTITIAPGLTPVLHGITGMRTLVRLSGTAQNAEPLTTLGFPLPYEDPGTPANGLGIFIDPTKVYVVAGNAAWLNYTFFITIEYTKTRT